MTKSVDKDLVKRYKKNYNIPDEVVINPNMVQKHWDLERQLTKKLWESNKENRKAVFEYCYSKLYSEIWWVNQPEENVNIEISFNLLKWAALMGKSPKTIYEVGSGNGKLITYLAVLGHNCKGSEITSERGTKFVKQKHNFSWGTTDGIHLEQFEERNYYDFVISD